MNINSRHDINTLTVALTGGIASGKSAVLEMLADLGAGTLDADQVARDVVRPGQPALASLAERFGPEVLDKHGALDRARLRSRVFDNTEERRALEQILHPAIQRSALRTLSGLASTSPYVVYAIPLLVETGQAERFDRVLVVDVSVETQLRRVMARDDTDRQTAMKIISSQASREQRLAIADDVLLNEGTLEELAQATATLHQKYLAIR